MAQHPQPPLTTRHPQQTVSAPVPPPIAGSPTNSFVGSPVLSPSARLAIQRHADLLASVRVIGPSQLAGIVSGPGNQGTACPANMQGHAGTGCDAKSVPRNLKVGQSGSKGT